MQAMTLEQIKDYVDEGKTFVYYRYPHQEQVYCLVAESVEEIKSLEESNEQSAFIFAPFELSPQYPALLLRGSIKAVQIPEYPKLGKTSFTASSHEEQATYRQHFSKFMEALQAKNFQKLVLARKKERQNLLHLDLVQIFSLACHQHPEAYCFLFYSPQTSYWLGASPELLLKGRDFDYETTALAGTQYIEEGQELLEWNAKLQKEQDYVRQYIEDILLGHKLAVKKSKTYSIQTGSLAHLRTDIHFSYPKEVKLGSLLKELHPTPALCGLPKEEAKNFIIQHEGLDRKYYSGFLGVLNMEQSTEIYVNIRCMNYDDGQVELYAGGGLLQASKLEEEWLETERKLAVMEQLLANK